MFYWAFTAPDESGGISFEEHKFNIIGFTVFGFIGLMLMSIVLAGERDGKETKVNKKAVWGGVAIAAFFLIWRLLMALF